MFYLYISPFDLSTCGATELQDTDKIIDFVHVQMLAFSFTHKVDGLHHMSALSLTLRLQYRDRLNPYKLHFYVYTPTFQINGQLILKINCFLCDLTPTFYVQKKRHNVRIWSFCLKC